MAQKLQLLTDAALGEGNSGNLDGLEFSAYASVLANAAAHTPGPFTIGVFGEWGTGKTSLMRMTQAQLREKDNLVTVWFNAWKYEQEQHPIVPLIATIIRGIERNADFLDRLGEAGKRLLRSLRAAAYGFSGKSKLKLPGFAEVEATFVAKDMIEREKELTPDPLLDKSLYYEAFETLSNIKIDPSAKIIVFIDDLDRCFPDQAIKLLESIKLVLTQPGFVFVLGVARNVLEGYLQHRYAVEYGISNFEGRSYLDKMVQLPFHIPPHKERMESFASKIINRLSSSDQKDFTKLLPIIGYASGHNPRSTVRYVNNLLVDIAINSELSASGVMEKIPLQFFAISRCLQFRWPVALELLQESASLAKKAKNWKKATIEEISSSCKDASETQLASLLNSDSELFDLLLTNQGQSWLSGTKHRKACIHFLRSQKRDFQPGIPEELPIERALNILLGQLEIEILWDIHYYLSKYRIECATGYDDAVDIRNLIRKDPFRSEALVPVILVLGEGFKESKFLRDPFTKAMVTKRKLCPILVLTNGTSFSDVPDWLLESPKIDAIEGFGREQLVKIRRFVSAIASDRFEMLF